MRHEKKFRIAMKKYMFTLLFIAREIKCNFASRVVGVNRLFKNANKPEEDVDKSKLEAAMEAYILDDTSFKSKHFFQKYRL